MGLCTLPEVKAQLNKTSTADDTELQQYIDSVTASVQSYCGTVEAVTRTETHQPCGPVIQLRGERVASITSVTEYVGTVAAVYTAAASPAAGGTSTYLLDPDIPGRLVRIGSAGYDTPFTGRVTVVYQAGFATVPAALNLAARLIVQTMWRTQNGGAALPQLSDEPNVNIEGFDVPVPARAVMLMDPYRRLPGIS